MMLRTTALLSCVLVALIPPIACGAAEEPIHRAAPVGSYGGLMNPDVSAVVNGAALFSTDESNTLRDRYRLEEAELAFQSYLYPGIHGDFIIAIHEHEGEWTVHPEEAYVSFLDLPLGLQAIVGRKLIGFGRLNPVHPHHWAIADAPLAFENTFGDHSWFDDGAQLDLLVPNPWDLYCKVGFGAWSGATLEHHHADETGDHHHAHALQWRGKAFAGRSSLDIPLGELSNVLVGYSIAWDEGYHTVLQGADITVTYRRPMSYRRVKLQTELFHADTDDAALSNPLGLYSMLALTWNQYWECGVRYDRAEFFHEAEGAEHEEEMPVRNEFEWGVSAFVTYYFTHSLLLRPEYRYTVDRFDEDESRFLIQLVWGLGPHAHRLED